MQFTAKPNASTGAMHGAGIEAAQTVANEGAKAVITGSVGPNAFQVLSQAGIEVITDASGTVREAIQRYKAGQLGRPASGATVPGHAGLGMGRGRGMGMTAPYPPPPYSPLSGPTPAMPKEQEIQMLEGQSNYLQAELERIKKRIAELK